MNIVWRKTGGGIAVTHIISEDDPAEHAEMLQKRGDIPADWKVIITAVTVPEDRTFRNAWDYDGTDIVCDLNKARDIQRDRLRILRAPKMKELDVQFMQAVEKNDTAAQALIATQKQKLRDITINPAIDNAASVEELKLAAMGDLNGPTAS